MNIKSLGAFLSLILSFPLFPNDVIVVTAEKIKTPISQTAGALTIIDSEQIENSRVEKVYDLLKTVPGVNVSNAGGFGQTTSVSMRGTNTAHVLVLIDGIEANDPISTGKTFDFAFLNTTNIERIEILKGPQSVLYGSDAIGGVIHIITKKGKSKKHNIGLEYGSFKHKKISLGTQNKEKKLAYSLAIDLLHREGFSAASLGTEKDSTRNNSYSAAAKYKFNQKQSLEFNGRYTKDKSHSDDTSGSTFKLVDDPNHILQTEQIYEKLQYRHFLGDRFDTKTNIAMTKYNRHSTNSAEANNPNSFNRKYKSSLIKIGHQADMITNSSHITTFGLDYEIEKGQAADEFSILPKQQLYTSGIYAQHYINYKKFFGSIGLRTDQHQAFGEQFSYKLSPGIKLDPLTLKGNLATGFKAPNIYQLHSSFGNKRLQPEESLSYDLAIDYKLGQNFLLSVTYFKNTIKNLITFPSTQYMNASTAHSNGFESSFNFVEKKLLALKFSYTRTATKIEETGLQILNIPKHIFSTKLDLLKFENFMPSIEYFYKGRRDAFATPRKAMPSYSLVNLTMNYQLHKIQLKLWLRLNNIFDKSYQEVDGYSTAGRSFLIGLNKSFL